MLKSLSNFTLAVSTLVGTIIGVGMFSLPYAAAISGIIPVIFYLVVLGILVTLLHLMYGEVVLRTSAKHRLAGYAEVYFGSSGKVIASVIFLINLYLALLVYLVVGGEFLRIIFSGFLNFSAQTGSIILAIIGFGIVFKGIKLAGVTDFFMTTAIILLIAIFGFYAFGLASTENLIKFSSVDSIFFPYGIVLFALAGGSAIPEIRSFFKSNAKNYSKAIILGTVIPVLVYAVFTVAVVSISGVFTSREAIAGLSGFLGSGFIKYGAIVGFLAVITSFFTIGLNLKNSFQLDFKLPILISFILTVGIPMYLFFSGFSDFIKLISLAGGVMGGLEALLIIFLWLQARKKGTQIPEYSLSLKTGLVFILAAMFLLGIVYEVIYTL
ncbi:MAG: aromatic amino acid transport family protein [bacterium]|nr:aromatic amino acid transport family protein [bacterium]